MDARAVCLLIVVTAKQLVALGPIPFLVSLYQEEALGLGWRLWIRLCCFAVSEAAGVVTALALQYKSGRVLRVVRNM
jgi:hypothetical protein